MNWGIMSQRFVVGGQRLRKRPEYLEGISLGLDAHCTVFLVILKVV